MFLTANRHPPVGSSPSASFAGTCARALTDYLASGGALVLYIWSHFLRKTGVHPRVKPDGRLFPGNALARSPGISPTDVLFRCSESGPSVARASRDARGR